MNQMDYHSSYPDQVSPAPAEPVDWGLMAEITPALFSALCWLVWGLFLLFPSVFGLHYAGMFSAANNTVFVLMGFVFCMAVSTAVRAEHGARAVWFGFSLFGLAVWF